MPDRIYRMKDGETLDYEVLFKRKHPELHAIASAAPAVHRVEVGVRKSVRDDAETLAITLGEASRELELGDVLSPVYEAVRDLAAEAGAPDVSDCALIFKRP